MRKALIVTCASFMLASAQRPVCPDDMVVARPGVCIDRYEYKRLGGDHPRLAQSAVWVTGELGVVNDAETLCALQGKRTCTRREWVDACRGPGGSRYPYGPKYLPGKCNVEKAWRSVDALKVMKRDEQELQRLDQSEPVGSMEGCVSPSGAADMVGNAEEWVRCDNGQEDDAGTRWCLVGGYWADARSSCTYVIRKHAPDWHYYETGFRCCLDMEE